MKNTRYILALAVIGSICHAQEEGGKQVFRDAATHEQLVGQLQQVSQEDPMKTMELSEGEDPSKVNQPQSLLDSSDFISFGGLTTLVPKRAIMQIPASFKERINNHIDGNRVVSWLDFVKLNQGWITMVEISRVQAEGNEPLAEAVRLQLEKNKNLVVATYHGGPISLLPLKEKKEESQTAIQNP